jgi:hypothetical protein
LHPLLGIVAGGDEAARRTRAHDRLEAGAGHEHLGAERILVAIARVEQDKPIVGVVEHEPFGDRFDRLAQLLADAAGVVARRAQLELGTLERCHIGERDHAAAIGQWIAAYLQPSAVNQTALIAVGAGGDLARALANDFVDADAAEIAALGLEIHHVGQPALAGLGQRIGQREQLVPAAIAGEQPQFAVEHAHALVHAIERAL